MPSWRRQSAGQIKRGPLRSPRINIPANDALQLLAAPPSTGNAGSLYAGDTAWNEVGATGQPAFTNSWANYGSDGNGTYETAAFIKLSTGLVLVKGFITGGVAGNQIFVLPVGYRPAKNAFVATDFGISGIVIGGLGALGGFTVGGVFLVGAGANPSSIHCSFYAEG